MEKKKIDLKELIEAGVHFGHQTTRWCPKMAPYIWGHRSNVHLIDVSKTALQLEKAAQFLHDMAANGKPILLIGTKKAAADIIKDAAVKLSLPYVNHRWIGGTLSNYTQVKKSVTKLLHFEDVLAKAEKFPHYTKKELTVFSKMLERLNKNVGGIRSLTWPVGALVIIDVRKEQSALREAAAMGVPVVAFVDTNNDPSSVDFVIPANDDAPKAIKILVDHLVDAIAQGQEVARAKGAIARAEERVAIETQGLSVLEGEEEADRIAARNKRGENAGGASRAGGGQRGPARRPIAGGPRKMGPKK